MTHKNEKKPGLRRVLTGILAALLVLLMILPMVTMAIGSAGAVTQSEIDALEEQQKESQARQDELNDRLDALADDKAAAQEKRQILEQQLSAIKTELDSIEAQIAYYDAAITQKEAERVEAVAREEAQYELFCERVRAMEEDGDVSYWSIIFQATDFADLLDRITIVDEIMAYDQQVMDDLVATRKRIEELKAELESDRAEQQVKKAETRTIKTREELMAYNKMLAEQRKARRAVAVA